MHKSVNNLCTGYLHNSSLDWLLVVLQGNRWWSEELDSQTRHLSKWHPGCSQQNWLAHCGTQQMVVCTSTHWLDECRTMLGWAWGNAQTYQYWLHSVHVKMLRRINFCIFYDLVCIRKITKNFIQQDFLFLSFHEVLSLWTFQLKPVLSETWLVYSLNLQYVHANSNRLTQYAVLSSTCRYMIW